MPALDHISFAALAIVFLVWGFLPGLIIRAVVHIYPPGDDRRHELVAETYATPRWERPFWVLEQLELALTEGLSHRLSARVHRGRHRLGRSVHHGSYTAVNSNGVQYYLYKSDVRLVGGARLTIYFFSASDAEKAQQTSLPRDRCVQENPRNGFLTIKNLENSGIHRQVGCRVE